MVTGTDASAANKSLVASAKALLKDRRDRDKVFAHFVDGFGEPAWDMLLALFIAHGEGRRSSSQNSLIAGVPVPPEIVRPYITWLASQGLTEGEENMVVLTEHGRSIMIEYLTGIGAGRKTTIQNPAC